MSLPSSTMEFRWPLPEEGYRTMASAIFTQKRRIGLVGFPTWDFFFVVVKLGNYV